MKATFTTKDHEEILRITKATEMALFIRELQYNNGWRELDKTGYDYLPAWNLISDLLEEYNINIDELIS